MGQREGTYSACVFRPVMVQFQLGEKQKAYICKTNVFNMQRFERDQVYTGNELF